MNEPTKEKNNMNEITKQIIAKFRYAAALADALERGETIQCHQFGEWWDLNCLTIDVDEISIREMFYGWRVKSATKYRPWTKEEAPRHFFYCYKTENIVWPSGNDRLNPTELPLLFRDAVRVLEDGTEVPCGVEVVENADVKISEISYQVKGERDGLFDTVKLYLEEIEQLQAERDRLKELLSIAQRFVGANVDSGRNEWVYDDLNKTYNASNVYAQIDDVLK